MGEMAEGMLDGTFCEECGDVFDDVLEGEDPPGYPRKCRVCEEANLPQRKHRDHRSRPTKRAPHE